MIVKIKEFIEKYAKGGAIPRDLRIKLLNATLEGKTRYDISDTDYRITLANYEKLVAEEQALFKCAELNNKGMAQEKSGNIDLAIETYEENIKGGYPATHSYDRLMILYRKRKDYLNELRIIDIALDVFNKDGIPFDTNQIREKYKQRKEKALTLLNKL